MLGLSPVFVVATIISIIIAISLNDWIVGGALFLLYALVTVAWRFLTR